jgi:hypothetical protein
LDMLAGLDISMKRADKLEACTTERYGRFIIAYDMGSFEPQDSGGRLVRIHAGSVVVREQRWGAHEVHRIEIHTRSYIV